MITRELALEDGRLIRFRLLEAADGEPLAIRGGDQETATDSTVEIFSADSGGDPAHPDFIGLRCLKSTLLEPAARENQARRGLLLRAHNRSQQVRLSAAATVWLIGRLSEDALEEVEITRAPRTRLSALGS
jgi:hypothetical protein